MIRNLAVLISLAVVIGGSCAINTQSVEAKTSRNNSRRPGNYFVPPPPPYTPSIISSELGMTYAQTVAADANKTVVDSPVKPYSKHISTRNQGDMSQVVHPQENVDLEPGIEARIQENIDCIDSEISSHQKEIGKLLNL